jgi:hypothetical protein
LKSPGVCPILAQVTYRVVPPMKRLAKARHQCRRCPLRPPSGRCLNPALRSGRCGDWIWYMRGGKQCRRRYTPPQGPGHTGATALPRPPRCLLQEVQPLADGSRAGCLHCCGGEAAEPLPAGSVGSADRAAVLGSEGRHTCKSESQAYEGQN